MKTITARSAWSWLREYWLNVRRIRFWIAAVVILYTLVGFLVMAWSSLFKWTAVIPTARLEGARVHEEQFDSGVTRFTRLLSEFQSRPPPRDGPEGAISRPEQTGPTLPIALEDIDFSLDDFIFSEDAVSPFQISGRFELGGEFAFDGEVQLLPELDLAGTLDVDGLALAPAEPFVQRFAHVRVESDSLSTEGDLRSGPGDPLTYAGSARINGELNPRNALRRTRFNLVFENMDIPAMTPYAVQFTGRRIAAGRMDLDLDYTLDDGQIEAGNHIVLRDLMLGERFEHPDATNLPLRLAIALLKDSDGVIVVDIPVQGSVNDPEFSFGPAIRQAIVDILQGIITAPFEFLAGLVDGDPEELATVSFAPGSSEIAPPQREDLDQLRAALDKRPELAVELPAPYAPAADRPALQRQRARAAMVERLDQEGIDVANPSLEAAATSEVAEAMFADRYPQRALADVRERFTTATEDEEPEFDASAYREHLATEVTAAETATEEDLEALARTRAEAVREFIRGESDAPAIEPDRVRSMAPTEVEANGAVVLEIGLAAE